MNDTLRFGPYTVELTKPDKVLFPDDGLTKRDLVDHYLAVADRMVPLVENRLLTMRRFPDGIGKEGFFQKNISDHFPDWIGRAEVDTEDGTNVMVVVNNRATLAYLAQQGCIEPHVGLSRLDRRMYPDQLIFDLDPPGDDFDAVRFAAHALHDMLAERDLPCAIKTTGSKGVHVIIPLDRSAHYDKVREVARRISERMADEHSDRLTVEHRKDRRHGRLYVDWLRNAYGQTAVAPYAVRARPGAPVAAPIAWDELDRIDARSITMRNVGKRLGQRDPWEGLSRRAVSLKRIEKAFSR